MMRKKIFSAMRPTGKLHLGHLAGALKNWVPLQDQYDCIFSIADWHALMGAYEQSKDIRSFILDMAMDWLACGLDPQKSILFVQSDVPEHLELQMIFACLTPLGWLERNPTYKEQLREITTRDLQTFGFLGYPVLQAADILLYKADAVPIGEDQLPHVELTREIARRFNHIFKTDVFSDCEALLTPTPRLLGTDGRKMSKSYQNTINLSDPPDEVRSKVSQMFTDPKRLRKNDPGHPAACNGFCYYEIFAPEMKSEVEAWCTGACKGCTECKQILGGKLLQILEPIQTRRRKWESDPGAIQATLRDGQKRAAAVARQTIDEIRKIVF